MTGADRIQQARADLTGVRARIGDLWEHLWAPEWQPESARAASGHRSKPPMPDPASLPVRRAYLDVVAELSRAHWALGRGTGVPVHWTRLPDTTERAATVPHSEALMWAEVLDGMLAWCAEHGESGTALDEACGHIAAALGRIDDLWPPRSEERPVKRPCANAANGCGNDARTGGNQCQVCANYRSRNGRDRVVDEDGRAA